MNQPMNALFKPAGIAVIGASRKDESPGKGIMKNLLEGNYQGKVFPVNPKADEVMGCRSYASVKDIEEMVDLAFIVVPRDVVLPSLKECAEKGVKAAVVISAGFKEVDEEGAELEEELATVAREHNMALLGPNCLGVINTDEQVRMNGTFASQVPEKGNISFISQSGAVGVYALEFADKFGISFARFASLGNKAVSTESDILEALLEDEQSRIILAYLEDLADPQRFLGLATKLRQQQAERPLIVLKAGGSKSGKRAAESHTGALTESDEVLDHLFEQYGIIRAPNLESLFYTARIFAGGQAPKGPRLCIITNAGGPGIITADAAEKAGLEVPPLSDELQEKLSADLPPTVSLNNPVDLVGDATAERYEKALKVLVGTEEVDILLFLCTPQLMTNMEEIAQTIGLYAGQAREKDKLLVAVFADFDPESKVKNILIENKVPYYRFGNNAVAACAAALQYRNMKSAPEEKAQIHYKINKEKPEKLLKNARMRDNNFMTEAEAYQLFETYGLKVAPYRVVSDQEDAKKAAESLGFPLVAKVVSEQVVHKTDAGGVFTNLKDEEELMRAYEKIHENVKKNQSGAKVKGILLQKMVEEGTELIIGARYSEKWGHLIMFGLGGIFVEMLSDVTFRRAPLSRADAMAMIDGIRTRKVLEGARGRPAPDKEVLADYLLRLSQLVQDFPQIKEIDINPLFAVKKGALIADARLFVREEE